MINVKKTIKKDVILQLKIIKSLPATRKIHLRKSQKIWNKTDK